MTGNGVCITTNKLARPQRQSSKQKALEHQQIFACYLEFPGSNLLENILDSLKATQLAKLIAAVSNCNDTSVVVGT